MIGEPLVPNKNEEYLGCVIPARGGSKGVPRKNLRPIDGAPLILRACDSALRSGLFSKADIYVSTEDKEIASLVTSHGYKVLDRPTELAGDASSTDDVINHAFTSLPYSTLVMLQCTSPFIVPTDIKAAYSRLIEHGFDSVITVVEDHAFVWRESVAGLIGENHDNLAPRSRRQDLSRKFRETGAIYAIKRYGFYKNRSRFGLMTGYVIDSSPFPFEIDSEEDLARAEIFASGIAQKIGVSHETNDLPSIIFTDFDGVLTDNKVYIDENGKETVRVTRADGLATSIFKNFGIEVVIVSTERNPVVSARGEKMGCLVHQDVTDKGLLITNFCKSRGISLRESVFIGNDLNDYSALSVVGRAFCPSDSGINLPFIRRLRSRGGAGVLRELIQVYGLDSTYLSMPINSKGGEVC